MLTTDGSTRQFGTGGIRKKVAKALADKFMRYVGQTSLTLGYVQARTCACICACTCTCIRTHTSHLHMHSTYSYP